MFQNTKLGMDVREFPACRKIMCHVTLLNEGKQVCVAAGREEGRSARALRGVNSFLPPLGNSELRNSAASSPACLRDNAVTELRRIF